MAAAQVLRHSLALTDEERVELLQLLETALKDARVEHRRTKVLEYRERVREEESVLERLLEKVRGLLN